MQFTDLHCHTEFSKDGLGRLEDLIAVSASLGRKYIAITDHGTVAGHIEAYQLCKDYGITPIFGVEGYFTPQQRIQAGTKVETFHITVLARNRNGWYNLLRMNTASHENMVSKGALKFPLINWDMLNKYQEDLIVLTGCPASMTYTDDEDRAFQYVKTLTNILTPDRVFAEVMFTMDGHDFCSRPMQFAKDLNIDYVVTNDCHFPKKGQDKAHTLVTNMRSTIGDYSYENKSLYVMPTTEFKDMALATEQISEDDLDTGILNQTKVTDMVEPFAVEREAALPPVSDEEIASLKAIVRKKLEEFCSKYPVFEQKARKRLEYEYSVFDSADFWNYFYILNDIVYFVRSNERFCTARGSGAGSFFLYLLNITTVNPLQYNLLFERFLNPARKDKPDVDLDIESGFRPEVLKYVHERWSMVNVNTSSTFQHKNLTNELGKRFGLAPKEVEELNITEFGLGKWEEIKDSLPEMYEAYETIIGQQKTVSIHAAALLSLFGLEVPLPIENWGGTPGVAWSESGAEKSITLIGGVKYDLLGVKALDKLRRLYLLTGVLPPEDLEEDFPYEILRKEHVLGLFQLDSPTAREVLDLVQPMTPEEVMLVNTLARPGALDSGATALFAEYKKNPRSFGDERIDTILAPTYSIIAYQEQVMELYAVVTGEGLEGADLARRILSPKSVNITKTEKWQQQNEEVRVHFFEKGVERGFKLSVLETLWDEIKTHSRYSFNKSHAAEYSAIAIRQAWYKKYFPQKFVLAMLQDALENGDNTKTIQDYVLELDKTVTIRPPSVLHSTETFEEVDGIIYLPLALVKNVTNKSVEALKGLRNILNGKEVEVTTENVEQYYVDLKDRLDKKGVTSMSMKAIGCLSKGAVWNKTVKTHLHLLGAFEGIEGTLKDAGLTSFKRSTTNQMELQIELMKTLIPTDEIREIFDKCGKNGVIYGIITDKQNKISGNGNQYTLYKLTGGNVVRVWPNGPELEKGQFIECNINSFTFLRQEKKRPPELWFHKTKTPGMQVFYNGVELRIRRKGSFGEYRQRPTLTPKEFKKACPVEIELSTWTWLYDEEVKATIEFWRNNNV